MRIEENCYCRSGGIRSAVKKNLFIETWFLCQGKRASRRKNFTLSAVIFYFSVSAVILFPPKYACYRLLSNQGRLSIIRAGKMGRQEFEIHSRILVAGKFDPFHDAADRSKDLRERELSQVRSFALTFPMRQTYARKRRPLQSETVPGMLNCSPLFYEPTYLCFANRS